MKPSHRAINIPSSPIRKLLPSANEAKKSGTQVIHLNIGQPDIPTPPRALESVRGIEDTIIAYGPSEGHTALREAVARYYRHFNVVISYESVLVTTGASEAILFALLSTCDQGDNVIIPEPFYANYVGFADIAGVEILPIRTQLTESFKLPTPSAFKALINEGTRAIILCNPNNPTGQLYGTRELQEIVELAIAHDLFLIVDEVYKEFCYQTEFCSVLSLDLTSRHVIVIDSISKVFSACGARVGFFITKNIEILHVVRKYAQMRLCPPYYGQQLALACFQDYKRYISEVKSVYNQRRLFCFNRLKGMNGVKTYLPNAAFYLIAELPVSDAELFCAWLLSDFNHKGTTVMLAPANGFYFTPGLGKSQVRIAYVLDKEKLSTALDCLEKGLEVFNALDK